MNTEFDPITHIGKVNGVIYPSVTQLLTEFGLQDLSRVPEDRLEYKRVLGTRVHAATVLLDNGSLDEEHFGTNFPECVPYLNAYRKFREIEGFTPIVKEVRLFSKKYRFHGAMDEVSTHDGRYGDRLCIIDYKCVFRMYNSVGPQTAGYEILVKENSKGLGLDKAMLRKRFHRFALILKPTENYDLVPLTDNVNDEQDFIACARLHWRNRNYYCTRTGEELYER